LGEELTRAGWRVPALAARSDCDIRDQQAVRALLERTCPTTVFNAAAYTDVDRAEREPDLAYAVNALGAEVVARAAAAIGAGVVHYSTDFVFDGELARPYDEFDQTSPQGVYARSKLAGEVLVAAASPRHHILRVGCLYGRGGRNFPSTIVRRLRAGEAIRSDRDRLGSPTWVREVARVSSVLPRHAPPGLYHCTAQGETSWADFARLAAATLDRPERSVEGVPSSALSLVAPRPRRAILDNRMLRLRGLDSLSSWQDALRAFIAEEINGVST
jgi:dTDP-4-dehydrorhamnose reductase